MHYVVIMMHFAKTFYVGYVAMKLAFLTLNLMHFLMNLSVYSLLYVIAYVAKIMHCTLK